MPDSTIGEPAARFGLRTCGSFLAPGAVLTEVGGEPRDRLGEAGGIEDRHGGGEREAGSGQGEPGDIVVADPDHARAGPCLDGSVIHPAEVVGEVAEPGADRERRGVPQR